MRSVLKITTMAFAVALVLASAARAESTGQYIDDATVTTKVKAALIGDSQLKQSQVSVQTNAGTVELTGSVQSKDQEIEAVRVANQVKGVKVVKDELQVASTQD